MGEDRLEPGSKEWHARQRRHRHNGYRGNAAMIKAQMNGIMSSDSTTAESKSIALRIYNLAQELDDSLKTRVDP